MSKYVVMVKNLTMDDGWRLAGKGINRLSKERKRRKESKQKSSPASFLPPTKKRGSPTIITPRLVFYFIPCMMSINKRLLLPVAILCASCTQVAHSFSFSPGGKGSSGDRHVSAAQKARREEEQRRKERVDESIPGKTSAIPGAKDFELNVERTEQEWDKQASGSERLVRESTSKGLDALRMFRLEEADEAFDNVYEMKPNAYCWQAGIVKFYLGDYRSAAEYFANNAHAFESKFGIVASEERIWRDACELKLRSEVKGKRPTLDPPLAQIREIDLLAPKETRKVIRIAGDLFSSSVDTDLSNMALSRAKLRSICGKKDGGAQGKSMKNQVDRKMWRLNSWFYLGLHYDVTGQAESSKECMKMALRQCISGNGNDIIQTLPMLHMARRDWFDDDEFEEDDGFVLGNDDSEMNTPSLNDVNAIIQSIEESVDTMKLSELQESLKRRGLKSSGSKSALKDRLLRRLLEDAGLEYK